MEHKYKLSLFPKTVSEGYILRLMTVTAWSKTRTVIAGLNPTGTLI